ncbi:universal stress protein [Streptomyces sp. cg36]|uniref:universal stress protein n=1 Tax=Streptomyces sp. cg36 TaxID=3238798 RepID=UPI0034E242B7
MNAHVKRVVVGVNGSATSLAVLRRAYTEACRREAELRIVVAYRLTPAVVTEYGYPGAAVATCWEREAALDTLRSTCLRALGALPEDLLITGVTEPGRHWRVLARQAWHEDDLLVVGPGPTGLRRLWHRSVAAQCARHARCQVLVVARPALMREYRRGLRRWSGWARRRADPTAQTAGLHDLDAA